MPSDADPYKVLGVGRDADLEEIRLAYRRAALACHPDNHDGDRAAAERKLRELIAAYRAIRRSLGPAALGRAARHERRTYTPQDYAREGFDGALYQSAIDSVEAGEEPPRRGWLSAGRTQPTRDETRTFIWLWAAAMVLACGVTYLFTPLLAPEVAASAGKGRNVLPALLVGEAIYVVSLAGIVGLLILTRTAVRLAFQLVSQRWRILPGPKKDRDLPRGSSGRVLPEDQRGDA